MPEILLDVSELEPCEPLEKTLSALTGLESNEWLRVLLRREPFPLYELLEKQAFCWKTMASSDASFELLIWRCNDLMAENAIRQLQKN